MILRCSCICFTAIFFYIVQLITYTSGSIGNQSPFFSNCAAKCLDLRCIDSYTFRDPSETNIFNNIVHWYCKDECRYECMWKTVESFANRRWNVPQFDGKWPFMRVLCFQEFASVVFSFTNLFAHYKLLRKLRSKLTSRHPMYNVWHVMSLVSLNGWVWSIVFHTRDTRFTEFMDYASAFAIILSYFYCLGMRILVSTHSILSVLFSCFCGAILYKHIQFLSGHRIDYSYHMQTTVAIASISIAGWLLWAFYNRRRLPHVNNCIIFMLISAVVGPVLELTDFPPIFWLFDAHSLWHMSTTFIHVYFYRFMIDDSIYLRKVLPDKYDTMTLPERYIKSK